MTTIADDLFAEALRLPEGTRAALAASLIDSLDTDTEAQWAAEIRRRIAALDAGAPTTLWDEVRAAFAGYRECNPQVARGAVPVEDSTIQSFRQ